MLHMEIVITSYLSALGGEGVYVTPIESFLLAV